jgi:hypothetical protein
MAKKDSKAKTNKNSTTTKVNFDYIKSSQFRVIRVDGVHGGLTPRGDVIQVALFSERAPIPKREEYRVENGKLGERTDVQQRDAIVREVEVEALVDLTTARVIHKWLGEKIELAGKIKGR